MTSAAKTSIPNLLGRAQSVIVNTLANPTIRDLVARHGYTETVLMEGQRLCTIAQHAVDAQAAAGGAARYSTEQARQAAQLARMSYQNLAQTVRAVFPTNASQRTSLEVNGPMPDGSAAFILTAMTLFNNAMNIPEIYTVLAQYGYDTYHLQLGRETIVEYASAVRAQALAKAEAKHATRAQTIAVAEIRLWLAQYLKIARVALRSEPALLRALGIVSPAPQQARQTEK